MEKWYDWIRNMACYLILVSVVINILPGKNYEKYIRLFTGLILILIIFQPLTGTLDLEDKLLYYFEAFTFRGETGDLTKKFLGIEEQRKMQMLRQYEEAVAMDVCNMAREEGWERADASVEIEADERKENYGMVTRILLKVSDGDKEADAGTFEIDSVKRVQQIKPVQIEVELPYDEAREETQNEARKKAQEEAHEPEMQDERTALIRRRLMSYYDLEENYVEIQIQDSKR